MIKDFVRWKTLNAHVANWRDLAQQAVTSLESNDANAAKLLDRGFTIEKARDLLDFILKAEAELKQEPPPTEAEDEDDADSAVILGAPYLSALQHMMEQANLAAAMVVQADTKGQGAVGTRDGLADAELSPAAKPPQGQRLFYSAFDEPGITYLTEGAKAVAYRLINGYHVFPITPVSVKLSEKTRLIIVGDWGSGVGRAQDVAKWMRAELDKATDVERHVIHLGDIYFAGWPQESQKRFLDYWPVRIGEAGVYSWCLNGNHDMYCGGGGLFDVVLHDPRFARQAGCSYFALGNAAWQFIGLDTAYDEWNLQPKVKTPNGNELVVDQVAWARSILAGNPNAKGVLLSHHQPYSEYEPSGADKAGKVAAQTLPLLQSGRVPVWLWGHEHRCVIYKPITFTSPTGPVTLPFGACLGHGGVPSRPTREVKPGVRHVLTQIVKYGIENFATMGFAVLDLDGASGEIRCINERGEEHFKADLP